MSLREDPATGAVWVGHYQCGISVNKTAGGPFQKVTRAAVPPGLVLPANGLPPTDIATIGRYQRRYHLRLPANAEISCLLADREGNAWLGNAGQGLWRGIRTGTCGWSHAYLAQSGNRPRWLRNIPNNIHQRH